MIRTASTLSDLFGIVGLLGVALTSSPTLLADTVPAPERAIRLEALVKGSQEDVWKAWTTTEGAKTFFAPGANIDARPDGPYEIFFNPAAPKGERGGDDMRVLAVQAPKMISFTWNAPPSLPNARKQRTSVVVRLSPADGGKTRVTLVQTGWGEGDEWDKAFEYLTKAWPWVLKNLEERFEKGPKDWTAASKSR